MLDTHARRFVQPLLTACAQWMQRRGWTPNGVTTGAFGVGVLAAGAVYVELPWLAVCLLWISGALDALDGTLARLTKQASPWGTLLDVTFDRLVELGILIAIGLKYPQHLLGLLLLTASIVVAMTVFLTVGALSERQGEKSFYYQAGVAERTEGFILLTILIVLPAYLAWTIGLFLFLELFTCAQRLREARRLLR